MRIIKISKLTSFLIGITMMAILLCSSTQVQASQDGEYTYTVTDGNAQITKYTGTGGVVTIPSTLGGFNVINIFQCAFQGCTGLTSVSIPFGIKNIGDQAFADCTELRTVSIPQSVTSMGSGAFADCFSLTNISIPTGVQSIGNMAFANCYSISKINIPQTVTSIGNFAFSACNSLTSIEIPKEVVSIGNIPFSSCISLKSITVVIDNPNYASIDGVLYNKAGTILIECPVGLNSISIPLGVKNIVSGAFSDCTGLTTITIPQGVVSIEQGAFAYCTGLTSITFTSATTAIYDDEYTIPTATKIIGYAPSTAKTYAAKYKRNFEVIGKQVSATEVTLNKSSSIIYVGHHDNLRATISPSNAKNNKNVMWKSSDTSVATVDSKGKVVGIKAGTAVITVTTFDGNKTATCTVTVSIKNKSDHK